MDNRPEKRLLANVQTNLYLDLMKRCLTNHIYDGDKDLMRGEFVLDEKTGKYRAVSGADCEPEMKYLGGIWPSIAHTMIGIPRLENLQYCVEAVLERDVPGDLIETGVWRGGATIFMKAILNVHEVKDRIVWVADSFEGLPKPNAEEFPNDADQRFHLFETLSVSLEEVRTNFERYGLLDDQVRFLKGWFRDTLPKAPIEQLSVLRLDGDSYESTMDGLVNLYPKLSVGGYVIVDDYGVVEACNKAVDDFRAQNNIAADMLPITGCGVYWQRSEG